MHFYFAVPPLALLRSQVDVPLVFFSHMLVSGNFVSGFTILCHNLLAFDFYTFWVLVTGTVTRLAKALRYHHDLCPVV